jgi:hypothetical protein
VTNARFVGRTRCARSLSAISSATKRESSR